MLVLTRKINEKIIIGDDVEIVLVDIGKDQVKIGINAPRSVKVHRWEVYEEIQKENREAAKTTSLDPLKSLPQDILNKFGKKDSKAKKQ
ncbi:MAG TPA: carbon storage regulator [Candidatus Riflebacteria bacterium]|jgi:carbon storage regulator|nr:MAG: carbon storage regulator [Candidatus Riflebacteria bacterium HGW-Riflebacteria-1]HAE37270.1 carbon storage regulator [Candidatus Riflebacteria bacterium]